MRAINYILICVLVIMAVMNMSYAVEPVEYDPITYLPVRSQTNEQIIQILNDPDTRINTMDRYRNEYPKLFEDPKVMEAYDYNRNLALIEIDNSLNDPDFFRRAGSDYQERYITEIEYLRKTDSKYQTQDVALQAQKLAEISSGRTSTDTTTQLKTPSSELTIPFMLSQPILDKVRDASSASLSTVTTLTPPDFEPTILSPGELQRSLPESLPDDFKAQVSENGFQKLSTPKDVAKLKELIATKMETRISELTPEDTKTVFTLIDTVDSAINDPNTFFKRYQEADAETQKYMKDVVEKWIGPNLGTLRETPDGKKLSERTFADELKYYDNFPKNVENALNDKTITADKLSEFMINNRGYLTEEQYASLGNKLGILDARDNYLTEAGFKDFEDLSILDKDYILSYFEGKDLPLTPDQQKLLEKLKDSRKNTITAQEYWNRLQSAARVGRYMADKFNIKPFEWAEKLFQSNFGRFITGEPAFNICGSHIRTSGNSMGILMDSGLLTPLLAHIEGEKSKVEAPDGSVEYFYRITLQINAKKPEDSISYNVDLYSGGQLALSIYKEDQQKKGSVSLVGSSGLAKYSQNNYDKICLRSSIGSTCNRFADIAEFAAVAATRILPAGSSASGTSSSGGFSPSAASEASPYNEW